jgi:hypothetical protein
MDRHGDAESGDDDQYPARGARVFQRGARGIVGIVVHLGGAAQRIGAAIFAHRLASRW